MVDLSALTADQLAGKVLLPLNRRIPGTGFEYREALVSLAELQTRANQRDEARADTQKVWDTLEAEVKAREAAEKDRDEALEQRDVARKARRITDEVLEQTQARLAETLNVLSRISNGTWDGNDVRDFARKALDDYRAALTTHPADDE